MKNTRLPYGSLPLEFAGFPVTEMRKAISHAVLAVSLLAFATAASAKFDSANVVVEPESIARQFPDPATGYATPAFAEGRTDFTSHAEVFQFVEALARRSPRVTLETIGHSQEGRAMALLVLSGTRGVNAALPTVMLLGQQHGNEPAGGEAALLLAQLLATERSDLLDKVNVLIVPRANPDGAEHFSRVSANGVDVNRDHLLVRTPEALAIAGAVRHYQPQVMLDLHEVTAAGRWVDKFGAMLRYDALLQGATTGNLNPAIEVVQARFLAAARTAIEGTGQRVEYYHTTSSDAKSKTVSMGGVNVDTGRNVGGLRNAVSILLETRGVGLGRAHFARRVQAHVAAAMGIIETAALEGAGLVRVSRDAGAATAALACRGDISVVVRQTPQRRTLSFLDAASGDVRDIEVDWRSSLQLAPVRERARPCGYLIRAGQTAAIRHLRTLGVKLQLVNRTVAQATWQLEDYVVDSEVSGQRQDARGAIADAQDIRVLSVHTLAGAGAPSPGDVYVSMNQPLAALVSAALEPDSQNSFAANRIMDIGNGALRRVMRVPSAFAAAKKN